MKWQDGVLAVSGFLFTVALLPMLKGKEKPSLTSSFTTASLLVTVSVAYATLGLWLAFVSTAINCTAWATLAIQRLRARP